METAQKAFSGGKALSEDVQKLSEWSPGVQSMICELEDL
jgi:hypothetical protein